MEPAFKEVAPGVMVPASARSVHYEHPTPDEIEAVAVELDAIRHLLIKARSRLYWATHPHEPSQFTSPVIGFRGRWSEQLTHVEAALTPLIAYMHPFVIEASEHAAKKRELLPLWEADPEHHIIEKGWSSENRPGTGRGCIARVPGVELCNKSLPCPIHGGR